MLHSLVLVWPRYGYCCPSYCHVTWIIPRLIWKLSPVSFSWNASYQPHRPCGRSVDGGSGGGGALLSLLILPIMFPVVIFGGGSIDSLVMSGEFGGGLIWLFATSMLALGVAPLRLCLLCA